jgi:hypothetical protein
MGIKVLPVFMGLDPSHMPEDLRCSDERIPVELRNTVNLNCLRLSADPTPEELGKVAKSVYAVLSSIFRSSLWRRPPKEFLHLLPDVNPGARGILFFGSLGDAIRTYAFGRHAVVCPTSLHGTLSGNVTSALCNEYPGVTLRPTPVSPETPAVIGSYRTLDFVAATVFNAASVPRSRDQRSAANAILTLASDRGYSVIFTPQLGTGPSYSYPRFQAYKSFLAGVLEYYASHKVDRYPPWIVIVVTNTNRDLFLGYNVGVTEQHLGQLCQGRLSLSFNGRHTLCTYDDTLYAFLTNVGQYSKIDLKNARLGIALGQGGKPLLRWPASVKKMPFTYSLNTKIGDTVCADGDQLVLV